MSLHSSAPPATATGDKVQSVKVTVLLLFSLVSLPWGGFVLLLAKTEVTTPSDVNMK